MSNHTHTVFYEDLAFIVEFDYFPASRGAREHGTGLQLEPDESESWEICTIKIFNHEDKDAKAVDVTDCFGKTMNEWFDEQINEHIHEDTEPNFGPDDNLYM